MAGNLTTEKFLSEQTMKYLEKENIDLLVAGEARESQEIFIP